MAKKIFEHSSENIYTLNINIQNKYNNSIPESNLLNIKNVNIFILKIVSYKRESIKQVE